MFNFVITSITTGMLHITSQNEYYPESRYLWVFLNILVFLSLSIIGIQVEFKNIQCRYTFPDWKKFNLKPSIGNFTLFVILTRQVPVIKKTIKIRVNERKTK